jgi:hypothetical protein
MQICHSRQETFDDQDYYRLGAVAPWMPHIAGNPLPRQVPSPRTKMGSVDCNSVPNHYCSFPTEHCHRCGGGCVARSGDHLAESRCAKGHYWYWCEAHRRRVDGPYDKARPCGDHR